MHNKIDIWILCCVAEFTKDWYIYMDIWLHKSYIYTYVYNKGLMMYLLKDYIIKNIYVLTNIYKHRCIWPRTDAGFVPLCCHFSSNLRFHVYSLVLVMFWCHNWTPYTSKPTPRHQNNWNIMNSFWDMDNFSCRWRPFWIWPHCDLGSP